MFKRTLAVIAALFASSTQACFHSEFEEYLVGKKPMDHDKFVEMFNYFESNEGLESPNADQERSRRMSAFAESVQRVIDHNTQEESTYVKGINKFSDLTEDEFVQYFYLDKTRLGADQHCSATKGPHREWEEGKIPDAFDWRDNNGVTPVKNQGHCGSCWTFSAVGALEAHMLIKFKEFTPLSEQQLIDCSRDYENYGCEGGLPSHAFEYIMQEPRGISTETAYPYTAKDDQCLVNPGTYALDVHGGAVNITEGDEVALAEALFEHGPVSVAFEVVDGFRDYKTGVYSSTVCKDTTTDVNHAVLAVGYGTEVVKHSSKVENVPYWIVKNSWGADWGDKGYFKIRRGVNMCGIAVCNSYPEEVVKPAIEDEFLQ